MMLRVVRLLALCACIVALAACGDGAGGGFAGKLVKPYGGVKTRPDQVATRAIILVHPHSGERLNLTYFHDGRYDPDAMAKINRLFRDRTTGEVKPIDPELIDFLVDIRTRLGLPPSVTFEILSGYRSPETNASLARSNGNVARESLHMLGYAVDFRIAGVKGSAIAEIAKTMQRGGATFYPRDNHVHVDIGNIRSWTPR